MERFIVSTGRCGSTLLSTMLSHHPDLLVVTEFMKALEQPVDQGGEPRSGDFFANEITRPNRILDLTIHRRFVSPEILYAMEGKNLQALSIPLLMVAALPMLTDKPEQLHQESIALAKSFPTQTMANHYRKYFEWLTRRLGKKMWIERSGASIEILPELARMYPDARFVHIHRDGPEAALSMNEHAWFRLFISFFFDPPTRAEIERTEIAGKTIAEDDPFTLRLTTKRPSLEQIGEFWSQQVETGFSVFAKMNPAQLLNVRFEDLVANPATVLDTIARFYEIPDSTGWIESAVKLVNGKPESRTRLLSNDDLAALNRGCRSGQRLLGRAGKWPGVDATFQLMNEVEAQAGVSHRN